MYVSAQIVLIYTKFVPNAAPPHFKSDFHEKKKKKTRWGIPIIAIGFIPVATKSVLSELMPAIDGSNFELGI